MKFSMLVKVSSSLVVLGALSLGQAATVTLNCSVVSSATELNQSIQCSQFSGLGSLSSVDLLVNGSIFGSISLIDTRQPPPFQLFAPLQITASATTTSQFNLGLTSASGFSLANPVFSVSFTGGPTNLNPGQTVTIPNLSGAGSIDLTESSDFGPYLGGGSFFIPVNTLTTTSGQGGGGNVLFGGNTTATASATITYSYIPSDSPVPEPGSMILAAAGLLGVSCFRKFRKTPS